MSRDIMASELRKARERILEQKQFMDEAMRQYNIQQKRACDAEAEVRRLRDALGTVEWVPIVDWLDAEMETCPWCYNARFDRAHKPDCRRQAALKGTADEPN